MPNSRAPWSTNGSALDIFCAGPDGSIVTQFWDGTGGWSASAFPITGSGVARGDSGVVAVARTPQHLDVFWVSADGAIITHWADATPKLGWADHPPFALTGPAAADPASGLAALARTPLHIDLFWIAPDGTVMTHFWDAGPPMGWAPGAFGVSQPGAARAGSPVTAIARTPSHLDVFWVTPDGAIGSTWWDAGPRLGWADHGTFAITAPDAAYHDLADALAEAGHLLATSAQLSDDRQPDQAAAIALQAVQVLQRSEPLPDNPASFWLQLADAVHTLVVRLTAAGHPEQVSGAMQEALDAYQKAVACGADVFAVAALLRTLSIRAADAALPELAVAAVQAAAADLRPVQPPPDRQQEYHDLLAMVLFDLVVRLVTAGHPDQAASPANEAVRVYTELAGIDPPGYTGLLDDAQQLAKSLAAAGGLRARPGLQAWVRAPSAFSRRRAANSSASSCPNLTWSASGTGRQITRINIGAAVGRAHRSCRSASSRERAVPG